MSARPKKRPSNQRKPSPPILKLPPLAQGAGKRRPLSWEEGCERFEVYLRAARRSPWSVESYLRELGHVAGRMRERGHETPAEVGLHDLREHVSGLFSGATSVSGKALRPATVARHVAILGTFFTFLHEDGLIPENPTARLERPKAPRPVALGVLTVAEVQRLLSVIDLATPLGLRDRACIELLYGTAIRASELRAIRLADLDLHAARLQVRSAKRGAPRVVAVPRAAVAPLRRYLRMGRPALVRSHVDDRGHVFLAGTGRRWDHNEPWRTIRRVAERAGLRAHPHAFRRALSTHLVREGVSVPAVRELLGHASLATTARYVEVDRAGLHRAVAYLDLGEPELSPAPRSGLPGNVLPHQDDGTLGDRE